MAADPDPGLNVDIAVVGDNTNTTVTVEGDNTQTTVGIGGDNPQTAVGIGGDNSKTNVAVTGDNGKVTINGQVPFQTYVYTTIYDDTNLKNNIASLNNSMTQINSVINVLANQTNINSSTIVALSNDLAIAIEGVSNLIKEVERQKITNAEVDSNLLALQSALNTLHDGLTLLKSSLADYSKLTDEQIAQLKTLLAALATGLNTQAAELSAQAAGLTLLATGLDSQTASLSNLRSSTEGSLADLQNTDSALDNRVTALTAVSDANRQSIKDTKNELKVVTIVLSSLVGLLLVGCGGMVYILRRKQG